MGFDNEFSVRVGRGGLVVTIQPDQLKSACARRGWSLSQLARRARISYPTLRSALIGNPIRPGTAWKLTRALDDKGADPDDGSIKDAP